MSTHLLRVAKNYDSVELVVCNILCGAVKLRYFGCYYQPNLSLDRFKLIIKGKDLRLVYMP